MELRDLNEEEPLEIEASKFDLNCKARRQYRLHGERRRSRDGRRWTSSSSPAANRRTFLMSAAALHRAGRGSVPILLADENVKAVLINIFGGIVRCDMVARGVVEAAKNLGIKVPVVVRLEGTNVEEGQRVIRESGLNFTVANGMQDAAEKVVASAA